MNAGDLQNFFQTENDMVTRRLGWWNVKPGEVVMAIEKGMGLKKGEKQVEIGPFRVKAAKPERLSQFASHGPEECAREGFPEMKPREFVAMLCRHHRITRRKKINRIEIEWL
jgi:hypothetical protein